MVEQRRKMFTEKMNIYFEGVDLGKKPDPINNPLAFVNCSESEFETRITSFTCKNYIYVLCSTPFLRDCF